MAVAALSNAALALTGSVAPQPSGSASAAGSSPESTQNFAKLVSRQSDQKAATDGEQTQPDEKLPADAPVASSDDPAGSTEGDATAEGETGDKAETLLADIEAMVAAAAQLGNGQPVLPVIAMAEAPTAVTDSGSSETPLPTGSAMLMTGTSLQSQIARADSSSTEVSANSVPAFSAALSTAAGKTVEAQTTSDGEPVPADPAVTADGDVPLTTAGAPIPAPKSGEPRQATPELTHIASLIASLRQAFAPTGQTQIPAALKAEATAAPIAIDPQSVAATVVEQAKAAAPTILQAQVTTTGAGSVSASETAETPSMDGKAAAAPTLPLPDSAKKPVSEAVASILSAQLPSADDGSSPATTTDGQISGLDSADPSVVVETSPESPELHIFNTGETPSTIAAVPTPAAPAITTAGDATMQVGEAGITDSNSVQQQTIDRHLDLARDTQWLDRLARDISRAADHQGHLKFQLNPEHLGALTVEIVNSAAGTAIRMSTETDQARQIIADAQPRLIAEVRAQGLRVAESHVDLNNQQSGGGAGSTGAQAQQGQQGQSRQPSEDHKPFSANQSAVRDDAADSAERDDRDLYA